MRLVWLLILVACGSKAPEEGVLHGGHEETDDEVRIRYNGTRVDVTKIPQVADAFGLPLTGLVDVTIDIGVPRVVGKRDHRLAAGFADIRCTGCKLGDDVAKLKPKARSTRSSVFAEMGLSFGHLTFDAALKVSIKDGRAELVAWRFTSPDLQLELALTVALHARYAEGQLDGCIRFRPTEALRKRDARTADLLVLVGAPLGADGFYSLTVKGTIGSPKPIATECTTKR